MSEAIYTLEATVRTDKGTGASRRLRREQNKIPAIVYGAGKTPVSLTLDHNLVLKALKNDAFYSSVLALNIDGKTESVVLKDMQRHPFKPKVMHMDFLRIKAGEKINMTVSLHFINEDTAIGVKQSGGVISHLMSEVEIRCLPKDLPEYIELDLEDLKVGEAVHLSDLKMPEGVRSTELEQGEGHDHAIASIFIPKVVEEEEENLSPELDDVV